MAYWRSLSIQPGSGLTFPWAEFLSKSGSVADVSMGTDGVAQGMSILIYWSDLPEAVQQLLGYSYRTVSAASGITGATAASPIEITSVGHNLNTGDVATVTGVLGLTGANGSWVVTKTGANTFTLNDSSGTGVYTAASGSYTTSTLKRILPWRHPYWTQLWCTRIGSVKPHQPTGNLVTWAVPADVQTGDVTGSPVTEYTLALLTLQFTRPNYTILADDDINGDESNRYLDRFWKPNVQMLSREGQVFVYSEGAVSPGGPLNKQFPGSVGQKLMHLKLQRTWYQLPEAAVYDSNGMPSVLVRFMGRVSSATFMGMTAGTVLLEGLDITPQPLQIPSDLMGITSKSVQNQYNVSFNIDYFDPPLGASATTRGHNTMPWAGNGKWYKVVSQVGGFTPFETADMNSMFKII